MKNVLIIVVLTFGLGAAGFVGTMLVVQQSQERQIDSATPAPTSPPKNGGDYLQQMQQSSHRSGDALANLQDRQNKALIGAGVGCAVGFVGALALVAMLDRRRKRAGGTTM